MMLNAMLKSFDAAAKPKITCEVKALVPDCLTLIDVRAVIVASVLADRRAPR